MENHNSKGNQVIEEYNEYLRSIDIERINNQYNRQAFSIKEAEKKREADLLEGDITHNLEGVLLLKKWLPIIINTVENDMYLISKKNKYHHTIPFKLINNLLNKKQIVEFEKEGEKIIKEKSIIKLNEMVYISLNFIINSIGNEDTTLLKTCKEIGTAIITQVKDNMTKNQSIHYYNRIKENTKTSNMAIQKRSLSRAVDMLGIDVSFLSDFDEKCLLHVGSYLVGQIIKTGLIKKEGFKKNGKDVNVLSFGEEAGEDFELLKNSFKYINIKNRPMIIKPMPWVGITGGGYLDSTYNENENINMDILTNKIARTKNYQNLKELEKNNMDGVYDCLNTLGDVPFSINKDLYNIINNLWNNGETLGKLNFKKEPLELPKKIKKEEYKGDDFEKDLLEYKKKSFKIHTYNNRILSSKITFELVKGMAENVLNEEEFYIPKNLDFRSRVYDMTTLLNNQNDDLTKSYIKFKRGKRIGESGLKYMKFSLSGLYGYDKHKFNKRVKWVGDNIEEITLSINNIKNGIADDFIKKADKPFQFIAMAIEYLECLKLDNPHDFVSHLEAQLDGSCSGIQHWCTILKDKEGAKLVNVVSSDQVEDIYRTVSDYIIEVLKMETLPKEIKIPKEFGNLVKSNSIMWLESGLLNRKITKSGVMTTPYSVVKFGLTDQLFDFFSKLDDKIEQGEANTYNKELTKGKSLQFFTNVLEYSIEKVLKGVTEGMNYLQELVRIFYSSPLNSENQIKWKTPLGFTIVNEYKLQSQIRVNTFMGDVKYKWQLDEDKKEMNKNKNSSSIAPNFIHSLDSTHLMMVVNKARKEGMEDFKVIHDSFGTHLADSERFHKIINEEFYNLYNDNDVLENFKNDLLKCNKDESIIEEIKNHNIEKGDLVLLDILKSESLFS